MNGRMNRRMIGLVSARVPDAKFERVPDPRRAHRRKWALSTLLKVAVVALCAGARSLREVENLTNEISSAVRRKLGVRRRLPDTTLRDVLVRLSPDSIRASIYAMVRAAIRRKAIKADVLPFGVASMDGKVTAIEAWDDTIAQRSRHGGNRGGAHGLVRTVTTVLISSRAKPILDASPIPPKTNEDGHFVTALDELLAAYGSLDLFRMVMYDSGACSQANAEAIRARCLHYTLRLDSKQPTLLAEGQRLLGGRDVPDAFTEEHTGRGIVRRSVFITNEAAGYHGWSHLKTIIRVHSERRSRDNTITASENIYYVSSLASDRLSPKLWIKMLRLRWGVENQGHHTLDVAFQEDNKSWITTDPTGMVVVALLRRIAYNLMTLFRSVTQRSAARRGTPWKDLLRWMYNALISATKDQIARLRPRAPEVTEEA